MGEFLGITGQAYGKKENGQRKFTPGELLKICNRLRINPNSIIEDSIKM